MSRFARSLAAAFLSLALTAATGDAVARDHGEHGEGRGRGDERAGPPGWARGGGERGGGDRGGERGGDRGGGRWERGGDFYGPPPGAYPPSMGRGARRGAYLPPEARGGVVQDYGRYRLRQPPRGYAWVRSGRAMMLMDMNTGQVFDVIPD